MASFQAPSVVFVDVIYGAEQKGIVQQSVKEVVDDLASDGSIQFDKM